MVVVGQALAERLRRPATAPQGGELIELVAQFATLSEAVQAASSNRKGTVDALIWQSAGLQPSPPTELEAAREAWAVNQVVVVYRFAGAAARKAFSDTGALLIHDKANDPGLGAALMVKVLADLDAYPAAAQPDDGVTYARKIEKAEARLDFSQPAEAVERQIRAFNPVPGAFFELGGERYRILAADNVDGVGNSGGVLDDQLTIACADRAIRPTIIQRAGKPAMPLAEFLRGNRIMAGTILS